MKKSLQTTKNKEKVKKFMDEIERNVMKGVIIVASADEEVWFAERVQMRLENEFEWQESPVLDQLNTLSEKYPRTGIILVQQDQVKLIDTNLNQVEDTAEYELDVEEDTWKVKQDRVMAERNKVWDRVTYKETCSTIVMKQINIGGIKVSLLSWTSRPKTGNGNEFSLLVKHRRPKHWKQK